MAYIVKLYIIITDYNDVFLNNMNQHSGTHKILTFFGVSN